MIIKSIKNLSKITYNFPYRVNGHQSWTGDIPAGKMWTLVKFASQEAFECFYNTHTEYFEGEHPLLEISESSDKSFDLEKAQLSEENRRNKRTKKVEELEKTEGKAVINGKTIEVESSLERAEGVIKGN